MSYASQAKKSSPFPVIRQETISRLSTEIEDRLAKRERNAQPSQSSWFVMSLHATVFSMGWPFK